MGNAQSDFRRNGLNEKIDRQLSQLKRSIFSLKERTTKKPPDQPIGCKGVCFGIKMKSVYLD